MRSMSMGRCWGAIAVGLWLAGPLAAWAQSEPPAIATTSPDAANGVPRGYLGAIVDDREDRGRGVRIEKIIPGGPAEKAGLRNGDLITGLGGIRVRQMSDFAAIVEEVAPGTTLTFELLRGEKREKIDVAFGARSTAKEKPETPLGLRAPLDMRAPGSSVPPPKPQPPKALSASPKAAATPTDDRSRIEMLERRLEQLERRIEALERALSRQPGK
jgi:membrane-associated protease RseP (regulator of RpoE activity)